jgi:hypothetical protein
MMNYYRDTDDAYEQMCDRIADALLERLWEERIHDLEVWRSDPDAEEMADRDFDDEPVQVFTEQEWNDRSIAEYREIFP